MTIVNTAVSATTTKALVQSAAAAGLMKPLAVTIANTEASTSVYVGGVNVTAATGVPILAGQDRTFFLLTYTDDLYLITAASTAACRVMTQAA